MTVTRAPAEAARTELSPEEVRRYSRHLVLPEVGPEGQRRLKEARVLLVGAGGLGSPLGLYLAAAGVGTLGLVDFDRVDESNLQRQILFGDADLGRPKVEVAIERLRQVNPHIELVPHPVRLTAANALDLLAGYQIIVDGSDNFPTRYLVNDACVLAGKPNVYGSIFRFEGQVAVFWGERGPCYRCLFAEPPPPGLVPSCAEGGVLGVLPGIIGALQANEVIKLALDAGEPLIGRLLLFDALQLRFRELRLPKSPDCPICSEHPTQTGLVDYGEPCDVPAAPQEGFEISPRELAERLAAGRPPNLVDVRTPLERSLCDLPGSVHVPLEQLERRLHELEREAEIVLFCHHGIRSAEATRFLQRMGYAGARNLTGGIDRWSLEVDPAVPRY